MESWVGSVEIIGASEATTRRSGLVDKTLPFGHQ
jgi:hypothetical protein